MSYYNTNGEDGLELANSIKVTETQEKLCLRVLFETQKPMTAFDVYTYILNNKVTPFEEYPILTSIRRALTDLANKDKIRKTNIRRQGAYNKSNYCYQIKNPVPQAGVQSSLFDTILQK